MNENSWNPYYEATREKPPVPFVVESVKHVTQKNKAIDIGAGALRNARFLLSEGFEVTTIDKWPKSEEIALSLDNEKIYPITKRFEEFDFPINEYDLVCAMSSLPFIPKELYNQVFAKIIDSLKRDGIFCGTFFGPIDSWKDSNLTLHTREEVETLFKKFKILFITEVNEIRDAITGETKNYHRINIIAKKN